jgi:hypothetical protein
MSKRSLVTPRTPGSEQDEETARSVLDSCIEQLSTAAIGDSQWVEACQLLGQIDPAFVPMQIEALADDRYQVCRALSVALSRIGPSIFYDVITALEHDHPQRAPICRRSPVRFGSTRRCRDRGRSPRVGRCAARS